mmetsp:Transcript_92496/g.224503  ORF Transcript_92496/g.224503 Transcript_92496/m.224503 type:complete len:231 (-) Transcript_92496:293-985(-)
MVWVSLLQTLGNHRQLYPAASGPQSANHLLGLCPHVVSVLRISLHLAVDVHDDRQGHVQHDEGDQHHVVPEPDGSRPRVLHRELLVFEAAQHDQEALVQGNAEGGELQHPVAEEEHASDGEGEVDENEDYEEVRDVLEGALHGLGHHGQPRLRQERLEEAEGYEERVPADEGPVDHEEGRHGRRLRVEPVRVVLVGAHGRLRGEGRARAAGGGAVARHLQGPGLQRLQED